MQTAIVTGPEGVGSLYVDEYGRVQVQFHWDRDRSGSCWVRVASNWAGGENGLASHPRVGSEVVVQWLDGNPDHPLITGAVHNQRYMPPWKLPQQRSLTGLRSRELAGPGGNLPGGRSNHLVLDDTAGRIQAQLRSDHQASQLSLGHIGRIEDNAGRKEARGQGFELRTDGHGVVRSQGGMLITTEGRPNAQAHITDMAETVADLDQARELHDSLSTVAQQAQAHEAGDQDAVVKALKAQSSELRGSGGAPEHGSFPEFQAPHLTLASPAGIQTTTRASTHQVSSEHHAITSGAHTSISSGQSLLASAKQAVRLFAYNAGIKLLAASGDVDITALKNSVNVLAKLNITHTANKIAITAKEEVVINGGTSYTRWDAAGVSTGTNGVWHAKAAAHSMEGPDNAPGPRLPDPVTHKELEQKQSLAFTLSSHAVGGRVLVDEPYELYKGCALVERGMTDSNGQLLIKDHAPGTPAYSVKLTNGAQFDLEVSKKLDPSDPGRVLANRGFRGPMGDQSRATDYANDDIADLET